MHIRMHDFTFFIDPSANTDGHTLGDISGIGFYPDRAMLLPGVCYLQAGEGEDELREYHENYLNPFGLGASELRFVGGTSLFDGVLSDPEEVSKLRKNMECPNATLEAFLSTREWERFITSVGVNPHKLRTPARDAMELFDDKEHIRHLASEMGLESYFPQHVFVSGKEEAWSAIRAYRGRFRDMVVVKRPDLESGQGQILIRPTTSEQVIWEYLDRYAGGERRLIVEQGVPGVELSLQWRISPRHQVQGRFVSRQYTEGGVHQGNVIGCKGIDALDAGMGEATRRTVVFLAWQMTRHLIEEGIRRGLVGSVGFDLMYNPNTGHLFLLECNTRTTAATYLESVRHQMHLYRNQRPKRRGGPVSAAMRNVYPVDCPSYEDVWNRLKLSSMGDINLHVPGAGYGVVIAMPRLLRLKEPKCLIIACAPNTSGAEQMLTAARNALEAD